MSLSCSHRLAPYPEGTTMIAVSRLARTISLVGEHRQRLQTHS
jgi:hypothetical protein